jgi:hypothetical protein
MNHEERNRIAQRRDSLMYQPTMFTSPAMLACLRFAKDYHLACVARVVERCIDTKLDDSVCAARVAAVLEKANQ